MWPARLSITTATMFARLAVLATIPIDDRHCFTHRFSPTGFILNAPDSHYSRPIALGLHSGENLFVQFNLRVNLALLLDEYLSPSVVNHTFLYHYPRDT
jgi:hypothetical protein